MSERRRVVVLGCGYVGLPLGIMLARGGHEVVGVDLDAKVLEAIAGDVLPITEQEIAAIRQEPAVRENLRGSPTPEPADVFILAVPTPLDPDRRAADLSAVRAAAEAIVPHLRPGNLVIVESTVPPRTCRDVIQPILERSGHAVPGDVMLCHCPERILPGNVFLEIVHNDRLFGGVDDRSAEAARALYASFAKGKLLITDDVTAESVKLMENAYRDVNVALANELARLCEGLEVDPVEAINLANCHPRVGILMPGIGVGGHCIPVDPWFLAETDRDGARLLRTARTINDEQPERIATRIRAELGDPGDGRIVALGAAYKPETYDVRSSPATAIVERLRAEGLTVEQHDPLVPGMGYGDDLAALVRGAAAVLVLVEHGRVARDLEAARAAGALDGVRVLRFYPGRAD